MNRRSFLGAVLATCTAPMIVRASSLMPVRARVYADPCVVYDAMGNAWTFGSVIGSTILITNGMGARQARIIVGHENGVHQVSPKWTVQPDQSSTYRIFPSAPV